MCIYYPLLANVEPNTIATAVVTVNGTIAGTRDKPVKFNVREDAGKIVLCYLIIIPENKAFMSGRCQTFDETAGKFTCMSYRL